MPEPKKRGPPKRYPERVIVELPLGTLGRIEGALGLDEVRAEFFRTAIEREIDRRRPKRERRPV